MDLETTLKGYEERVLAHFDDNLKPIQERLLSLEERNSDPGNEIVKELEAKLTEQEGKSKTILEEIRLLKVGAGILPAPDSKAEILSRIFTAIMGAPMVEVKKAMQANGGRLPDPGARLAGVDVSLFGTGGKLPIDVLDSFLDYGVDRTATLNIITRQPMLSDSMRLDRMHAGRRAIVAGVEQTAPTTIGNITTPSRSLAVLESILPEDISLDWLENNIERAGGESTVVQRLARAFANDHDDLFWNGDEADVSGEAAFLSINDGIFVLGLADGDVNDYDATGDTTAKEVLNSSLRTLAAQYRIQAGLTFFLSVGLVQTYADEVADRQTAGGDAVLVGGFPSVRYFGIPLIPESNITGASGLGWCGPRADLVWGVQRDVRIDNEWVPRKRQVEYTVSAKTDNQYGYGAVHVRLNTIPAGLSG